MEKANFINVVKRIQKIRNHLGISQKELAAAIGMNEGYLSQILRGERDNPGFAFLYKISVHFNVSLDYLVHGIGKMFLPGGKITGGSDREFINHINDLDDLVWLMEHSKMFRDIVMGFAGKTLFENEEIIKTSIKRYNNKREDDLK
jgi:transcriptional regulator with XRE-family HTH domain